MQRFGNFEQYEHYMTNTGWPSSDQRGNQGMGGEVYSSPEALDHREHAIQHMQAAERAEYEKQLARLIERFGTYDEKPFGPRSAKVA